MARARRTNTLVWDRPEPPSAPTPTPLSRATIVAAALALADADGLDAVSLRKVAAALGAGPMRIYSHLATKAELLDLLVDAVHSELTEQPATSRRRRAGRPDPHSEAWREALHAHAHRLRAAAGRHEWFVDLLGGRPHLGPHALAHLEGTLAPLDATGAFPTIDDVMTAVATVNAYVVGALRSELAGRRAERESGVDEHHWQLTAGPYLSRLLATGDFPTVSRMVTDGQHHSPEMVFEDGLQVVLDGIAARLDRAVT